MRCDVVVGGQFGSEGKGHVTAALAERAVNPLIIRIGGPNAGHTAYDSEGRKWALRQVPVGIVTNRNSLAYIAAGSEIDPHVLIDEIKRLMDAGVLARLQLMVDAEATIIQPHHAEAELRLTHTTGSTGKGIGAARAERLLRKADRVVDDGQLLSAFRHYGVLVVDGWNDILLTNRNYQHIIIEGVQGYGLGQHSGFYPHVTSSDCRAVDFMAMAGISPWQSGLEVVPWVVARPYPIRIAGPSGPLKDETTWEELGLPEEITTVTKKVRRVGGPDWKLVRDAIRANGGRKCRIALTMADQVFPDLSGATGIDSLDDRTKPIRNWLAEVTRQIEAPICMITTSPTTHMFLHGE